MRKVGVYAHLELDGGTLSEAQKRMIEMYDEKKKKDEKKKGMEAMDGMTKTSIKDMKTKPDGCEPEEEEKPDLRSKYAMINLIKNKLRAAGQRDPMVMAVDACEEKINEVTMGSTQDTPATPSTPSTPATQSTPVTKPIVKKQTLNQKIKTKVDVAIKDYKSSQNNAGSKPSPGSTPSTPSRGSTPITMR